MTIRTRKATLALLPAALALLAPVTASFAQTAHRPNFIQRHPTMSAIGAGAHTRHEIKAHTAH